MCIYLDYKKIIVFFKHSTTAGGITFTSSFFSFFLFFSYFSGFAVPGQPPSYAAGKVGGRQDSIQSDNIMLGGGLMYQSHNPPLSHIHKSSSDACLFENHKQLLNPPPYDGAMITSASSTAAAAASWLDQHEGGGGGMMAEVSPVGSFGMSHSNLGSLPQEGLQMNFLDDLSMHKQNPGLNGFSHGESFLEQSLPPSSTTYFAAPDEQALFELGLSTS